MVTRLFAALGIVAGLLGLTASAQVIDTIDVSETCSYYGEEIPASVATFASSSEAEDMISRIMDATGLVPNFDIRAGGVPNAAAVIQGRTRADAWLTVKVQADCAAVLPQLAAGLGDAATLAGAAGA